MRRQSIIGVRKLTRRSLLAASSAAAACVIAGCKSKSGAEVCNPYHKSATQKSAYGTPAEGQKANQIAQDHDLQTTHETILGPQTSKVFPAWLGAMKHWRSEQLAKIHYRGDQYDRPELKWTQTSFIQPQMMVEDRYFYDPVAGRYTVDRYLDDLEKRYGGVDSVLIWPTYPNIGIDNRNQCDMVRALVRWIAC